MRPTDELISHDTPRAAELLAAARRHLLDELLPSMQGSDRYSALMIANALSIVLAELRQERGGGSSTLENDAVVQLCRQLREGTIDKLLDDELVSRLRADVERRLSVANPKRLTP